MILSFYLKWTKFTRNYEFDPSSVVWVPGDLQLEQNSQEEYMESELPGIIRVKVVAKNILLGSLGTQHQAVFAM